MKIVSEDQVSATVNAGVRNNIPEAGVYVPSYKGVNHVIRESGGAGTISLMGALANMGDKYVREQQQLYDNMEVMEAMSKIDSVYQQETEKFFQDSPDGKGYTQFATGIIRDQGLQAISNASNAQVKQTLQTLISKKQFDVGNSAFQKERQVFTGHALFKAQEALNQVLSDNVRHPENFVSNQARFTQIIDTLRNVVPAADLEKAKAQWHQGFLGSVALGQIEQNPEKGIKALDGEIFDSLTLENREKIKKRARYVLNDRKMAEKENLAIYNAARTAEQNFAIAQWKLKIVTGEATLAGISDDSRLGETEKLNLQRELIGAHKSTTDTQFRNVDILNKASEGRPLDGYSQKEIEQAYDAQLTAAQLQQTKSSGQGLSVQESLVITKDCPTKSEKVNQMTLQVLTSNKPIGQKRDLLNFISNNPSVVAKNLPPVVQSLSVLAPGLSDLELGNFLQNINANLTHEEIQQNKTAFSEAASKLKEDHKDDYSGVKANQAVVTETLREMGLTKGWIFHDRQIGKYPLPLSIENHILATVKTAFAVTEDLNKAIILSAHMLKNMVTEKPGTKGLFIPNDSKMIAMNTLGQMNYPENGESLVLDAMAKISKDNPNMRTVIDPKTKGEYSLVWVAGNDNDYFLDGVQRTVSGDPQYQLYRNGSPVVKADDRGVISYVIIKASKVFKNKKGELNLDGIREVTLQGQ